MASVSIKNVCFLTKEQRTRDCRMLKSILHCLLSRLRKLWRRGRKTLRAKAVKWIQRYNVLCTQQGRWTHGSYDNLHRPCASSSQTKRGDGHGGCSLVRELLATDRWERGKAIFVDSLCRDHAPVEDLTQDNSWIWWVETNKQTKNDANLGG